MDPLEEERKTMAAYWQALGEFVHHFARLEMQLQYVLWQVTKTDATIAMAIFSGVRADQAKDFINRTLDAQGEERGPWLSKAWDQLGNINAARNAIVHSGIEFAPTSDGGIDTYVTNEYRVIPSRVQRFPVTIDTLRELSEDTQTIHCCCAMYLVPLTKFGAFFVATWEETANRPWHYKPQPQYIPLHMRDAPDQAH